MRHDSEHNSPRGLFDYLSVVFFISALCLTLFGSILRPLPASQSVLPLPAIPSASDQSSTALEGSGFVPDGVFPTTQTPPLNASMRLFGSWLKSDDSTGSVTTRWFRPQPKISLFTAGYPSLNGNYLAVEAAAVDSRTWKSVIKLARDPGERWELITLTLPEDAKWTRVRIIASDGSTGARGWLGFSLPGKPPESQSVAHTCEVILLLLTLAAGALLYLGPGLLARAWYLRRKGRLFSPVWLPIPGLLYAGAVGVLVWKGPRIFSSSGLSRTALLVVVAACAAALSQGRTSAVLREWEKKVCLIVFATILIASAKATYSLGPSGELYGGTISRTLEVGDRSDSRINYHLEQIFAYRWGARSPGANQLLGPWDFSQRGPVAALAAAPLVFACPVKLPTGMPDQPWTIFDSQGFAAYRSANIIMSACSLITVFGLMCALLPIRWAYLTFSVIATTPFVLHEIYFTWPKLMAACVALLSSYLVLRRRHVWAGLVFGFAYLIHPSILLWTPSLLALIYVGLRRTLRTAYGVPGFGRRVQQGIAFCSGLAFCLLMWFLVNRKSYHQGGFFIYFRGADRLPFTWGNWLWIRWESLLNTVVPLHLFLFYKTDYSINSVFGLSPEIIHFFFGYWNTIPFGVGITFLVPLCVLLLFAFRRWPWLLLIGWVLPFLFFVVYWGAASSGLLREGLHPWLLGLLCVAVAAWSRLTLQRAWLGRLCAICLLMRGIEVVAMIILPTVSSNRTWVTPDYAVTDGVCLAFMTVGPLILAYCSYRSALDSMQNLPVR